MDSKMNKPVAPVEDDSDSDGEVSSQIPPVPAVVHQDSSNKLRTKFSHKSEL